VISTRLIRLMGGELQLSSVLGQGSTFSFTLELQAADFLQTVPLLTAEPAAQPEAAVRVLLVDDNPHALATSAAMMRGLGWDVTLAESGVQALERLRADLATQAAPWDALFVDAEMPDMDGWETLRHVRRLYASHQSPLLILLSRQSRGALSQRTDREQELLDGLIVKPLTSAMFTRSLEQARNGSRLQSTQPEASPQPLQGMRILLVEDNLINQQVAQELLHAQGARVTLADNGALGLKAIRDAQPPFDVVLMDLQMPVMDGLSATRLLRADARFADLPVIAMTANAMHSDREDCLAAGMNDHVGKPFDLSQLVQTLITHTGWVARTVSAAAMEQRPAQPPVALPASAKPGQDWPDGLEIGLALLRMGGNRQLLQRAITGFVADARQLPQRLDQCLQQGDPHGLKRELHGFKGLSATVGVPALAAFAADAEKQVQTPQGALAWQAMAAQLLVLLERYLPLLEKVAAQLGPDARGDGPAIGAVVTLELEPLRGLLAALQTSDMMALEMYAALRQNIGVDLAQALEPLDLAMADLEFEAAATECEKLLEQFNTRQGPVFL